LSFKPLSPAAPQPLRLKGGAVEAPLTGYIFSLFKAIVGSGILSLSNGVAAFSDSPSMLLPSAGLAIVFAIVSAYCYSLIGLVCHMNGATSYQDAWARSIGASSAWLPGFACTSQTLVACTAYAIIIGDLGHDIAQAFGVTGFLGERNNLLASIAAIVLLPLCLLRSFSALAYTSMLGVTGVVYTAVFMVWRYFEGTYSKGGSFHKMLPKDKKPFFGSSVQPVKSLILMAMLNTAYHAHYDAPKFYWEMVPRSMERFNRLVYPSFLASAAVVVLVMCSGFMTFGGNSNGLILNSYATADQLAIFGRVATSASIICSYPLVFNGFRTGAFALAGVKDPSQGLKDAMAFGTVALTAGIAMVMNDLGFVASFAGALLGSSIIYVFPAMMHMAAVDKAVKEDKALPKRKQKGITYGTDYTVSQGIAGLGCVLGLIGALVSYLKKFTTILD